MTDYFPPPYPWIYELVLSFEAQSWHLSNDLIIVSSPFRVFPTYVLYTYTHILNPLISCDFLINDRCYTPISFRKSCTHNAFSEVTQSSAAFSTEGKVNRDDSTTWMENMGLIIIIIYYWESHVEVCGLLASSPIFLRSYIIIILVNSLRHDDDA